MIKSTFAIFFLASSLVFGAQDPIGKLVTILNGNSMWENGFCAQINLPENALSVEIAMAYINGYPTFDSLVRRQQDFRILEKRDVTISSDYYTALLIKDEKTRFVLLYRKTSPKGWWARGFPIDD